MQLPSYFIAWEHHSKLKLAEIDDLQYLAVLMKSSELKTERLHFWLNFVGSEQRQTFKWKSSM